LSERVCSRARVRDCKRNSKRLHGGGRVRGRERERERRIDKVRETEIGTECERRKPLDKHTHARTRLAYKQYPHPGFLATYWVPGAIGHSILRPKTPILTESQSSLGVPRPRAFTPSLLLLVLADEFIEKI